MPSEEADKLALLLARRALTVLPTITEQQPPILRIRRVTSEGRGQRAEFAPSPPDIPQEPDLEAAWIGLPLTLSLWPAIKSEITKAILLRRLPRENPKRALRARLGWELIAQEAGLWQLVARAIRHAGGDFAPELPYATRLRALRWWWEPEWTPFALCLRCGGNVFYERRRRRDLPLCRACVKQVRGPGLNLPEHAIAPAGRGTWWLTCRVPGCARAFRARAQARFCPQHRLARITKAKRACRG